MQAALKGNLKYRRGNRADAEMPGFVWEDAEDGRNAAPRLKAFVVSDENDV